MHFSTEASAVFLFIYLFIYRKWSELEPNIIGREIQSGCFYWNLADKKEPVASLKNHTLKVFAKEWNGAFIPPIM